MVVGSVIAAIGSSSLLWLVIGRALRGIASALIPVGMSIMRDELPKEKLGSAVALLGGTVWIGSALALPLAGVLHEHLGWISIFWFSALVGLVMLLVVIFVVPESVILAVIRAPGRFDYVGAVVLASGLVTILLAITKGGFWGWTSQPVLLLFLAAAIVLGLWVPYELKAKHPMVDLRGSIRRPVLMTNLASLLIGFAMFVHMLVTTQQLQLPPATGYGFGVSVIIAG